MKKTVKIGFTEQSKAVTANVSIEYSEVTETLKNEDVLKETEALMNKAMEYSTLHTMRKSRL